MNHTVYLVFYHLVLVVDYKLFATLFLDADLKDTLDFISRRLQGTYGLLP